MNTFQVKNLWFKPGCHLHKYPQKCAHIYSLARALVMLAKKGIFPTAQLANKYARIYAHIYASGIQAY
jgi:hypothetical protein